MFISADTMAFLQSLGLSGGQMVELVQRLDADAQAVAPVRSSGAVRQARYRDNKRNGSDASVTQRGDVTPLSEGSHGSLCADPPNLPNLPNLSQEPPIVPQNQARKAKSGPAKGAFARFWAEYPSKVGKLACERAYPRAWAKQFELDPESDPDEEILGGLRRCKERWEPEFIPNPLTFLNQGRWMDQPKEALPDSPTDPPKFDLAAFEARRQQNRLEFSEDAA